MRQIYLSYSSKDESKAALIYEGLRGLGFRIWWSAKLSPRAEWALEMGQALQRSDAMVVLVTPNSLESDLVKQELTYAASHLNFEYRVFPVLLEPTAELPWLFSIMKVFDLTRDRARGLRKVAQAIKAGQNRTPPQKRLGPARKPRS